jgi:hypothetical protein
MKDEFGVTQQFWPPPVLSIVHFPLFDILTYTLTWYVGDMMNILGLVLTKDFFLSLASFFIIFGSELLQKLPKIDLVCFNDWSCPDVVLHKLDS